MSERSFGGIVICSCGGKIIATNDKIMLTEEYNVLCRSCYSEYDIDEVFKARKLNTKTTFYRDYGKPAE